MSLPRDLQESVAGWLENHAPGGGRRAETAALSATYRAGGGSRSIDLGAYLVARLPATYAAVSRVLGELSVRRPEFSPASVLDAGSGPGTASWAAAEIWPALAEVTFLDHSPEFLALACELAGRGPAALAEARAISGGIERIAEADSADLVIAAYALAELPLGKVAQAAHGLWKATRKALVLVEPGTPNGFARIRAAREALLANAAVPVAPCTHSDGCPLHDGDWCHFSVRLARSRAHMHAKGAHVPFEDERFSYLVLTREGKPAGGARVLAPPFHAKPGVSFRLCTQGRVEARHVARRGGAAYKLAKKLEWGSYIPAGTEEETT